MRHAVITRIALALVGLLALASLLFAWRASAPSQDVAPAGEARVAGSVGAASFQRECAGCHEPAAMISYIKEAADPAGAVLQMLALLDGHGEASPADDRTIVAYLLAAARGRP